MVTPNFNHGRFLEQAIRSVLLQGYPHMEYIVIDGGSTDESTAIIRKYEPWLTYWASEKDHGLADAINKGFSHATGQVFGWLNADDVLSTGAILELMELRARSEPETVAWSGATRKVRLDGTEIGVYQGRPGSPREFGDFGRGALVYQPSTLFDGAAFRTCGGIDRNTRVAVDVDLWINLAYRGSFVTTGSVLSTIRIYPQALHLQDRAATIVDLVAMNHRHGYPDVAREWLLRFAAEYARTEQPAKGTGAGGLRAKARARLVALKRRLIGRN